MNRKAESGITTFLVAVSYAVLFCCALDWAWSEPARGVGYAGLEASKSIVSGLPAALLGATLVGPYLLWRSRAWGVATCAVAFVVIPIGILVDQLAGGSEAAEGLAASGIVACVSSVVGLIACARFLWILSFERRAWLQLAREDSVALSDDALEQFGEIAHESRARQHWLRQTPLAYLWLALTIVSMLLTFSVVSDTENRRARSFPAAATVRLVEVTEEDGTVFTEARALIADMQDLSCGTVIGDLEHEGLELDALVEPSAPKCELLVSPQHPWRMLGLTGLFGSLTAAEVLRRRRRNEQLNDLAFVDSVLPLVAIKQDGTILRQRLSMFDDRIVVEANSFADLPSESGSVRAIPMLPLDTHAIRKSRGWRDKEYLENLVLTAVDLTEPKEAGQQEADSAQRTTSLKEIEGPTVGLSDLSDADSADQTRASLKGSTPATGGPYFVVTQVMAADKLLIVDPRTHTVLHTRLLGGVANEGFPQIVFEALNPLNWIPWVP